MRERGRKPGVSEILPDDHDTGSSFLDCAVEIAQFIDNLEGHAEVISLIAIKYAESGQLDVAVAGAFVDGAEARASARAQFLDAALPPDVRKVSDSL